MAEDIGFGMSVPDFDEAQGKVFSTDRKLAAAYCVSRTRCDYYDDDTSYEVLIWDALTRERIAFYGYSHNISHSAGTEDGSPPSRLEFTPDSRYIIIQLEDGTCDQRPATRLLTDGQAQSRDREWTAAWGLFLRRQGGPEKPETSYRVQLFRSGTDEVLESYFRDQPVDAVEFISPYDLEIRTSDGKKQRESFRKILVRSDWQGLALSPDGELAAEIRAFDEAGNQALELWNRTTGAWISSVYLGHIHAPGDPVLSVGFGPGGVDCVVHLRSGGTKVIDLRSIVKRIDLGRAIVSRDQKLAAELVLAHDTPAGKWETNLYWWIYVADAKTGKVTDSFPRSYGRSAEGEEFGKRIREIAFTKTSDLVKICYDDGSTETLVPLMAHRDPKLVPES